ncbi:MAG: head GIN domain-containing protein [Lautropia sp.]
MASLSRRRFVSGGGLTVVAAASGAGGAAAAAGTRVESRTVAAFTAIECDAVGELIVEQSGREQLSVEAEPRLLPRILTTVDGGVLRIRFAEGNFSTTEPIRFRVGVRTLERLEMRASGDARVGPLETPALAVRLDGSVDAVFDRLKTTSLDARLNGSTSMAIESGRAERQTVAIAGSGDYRAGGFRTDDTTVTIDGSADATVHAERRLDARVAGSASLAYRGRPRVERRVSGSATVEHVD